jgi:LPS-assembly lipoprotein
MRGVLILLTALGLAACGFHPRGQLDLPTLVGPVAVETTDPYSPLGLELARALDRAGAMAPVAGTPSSTLRITGETWNTRPLSVNQFAQVLEYITQYRVDFVMVGADGELLTEPQSIQLSREYTYSTNASIGNPAEMELIQRELRRDMQAAILRRLDVALRPKA